MDNLTLENGMLVTLQSLIAIPQWTCLGTKTLIG